MRGKIEMRVGINALLLANEKTGIGYYISNLIENLAKFDNENQYFIFYGGKREEIFRKDNFTFVSTAFPTKNSSIRVLWENTILPFQLKANKVDVFHSPAITLPFFLPCNSVVTITDLVFLHYAEMYRGKWNSLYLRTIVPLSVKKADKIFAISESTKYDLISTLGVPENKIVTVHMGVGKQFVKIEDKFLLDRIKHKYGLTNRIILYVGTLEPRKNIVRLIEAYARLKREHGVEHKLVIVGRKGWSFEEIFATVVKHNLGNNVIFTGYVPEDELPVLYNLADIFVYPSFYEGFGIPPLEAISCGVPVITSNRSSLPEVVGDAAILVDPTDLERLADKMYELLTDETLRERMIQKGFKRAKMFSWEKCARETLKVYEEVYRDSK